MDNEKLSDPKEDLKNMIRQISEEISDLEQKRSKMDETLSLFKHELESLKREYLEIENKGSS